ncbi:MULTISPECIES: hypothetical protein [unclassified Novosphingobium]|jgi:hypothetical protein|uniref:hypothetical protein n=1 Tax=unclassified Novosphingobium TaxID=2644732 RepID=UPI000F5DD310|nr:MULTISPECIES: hypothetical protein [unclassified Novosphingobium]MBF5089698.1 hypothetical protein [Novosphingobium sp. NBM11]RQW39811.1 hypothetical protein EH199_21740 [Novosphingobium sp. LASN5T]
MVRPLPVIALLAVPFALAACAQDDGPRRADADDPVMAQALEGQLMVDPDLSQRNLRNQAVVPGGPVDTALVQFDRHD